MATTKYKAFIYARQSSGKEEQSESIEMQKQNCMELAAEHQLEVIDIFEDPNSSGRLYPSNMESLARQDLAFIKWYKGQSREKEFRVGLGRMFPRLSEVSFILVDDLTRLARPVAGSFLQNVIQQQLVDRHVKILTVKDGEVDLSDFCDRLMADIQASINDNQLRIQRKKAMDAMHKLKDEGIYPTMPKMFGIRYLGKKIIEVDQESAECIRYIYDEILKCRPYNAIMGEVNARYGHLFKGTCYPSTLKHIATQPFYCGYMHDTHGNLIQARQMHGKEIISYDKWRNVQNILANKRAAYPRAQFRSHPFTGLLYCGACGARLVSGFDNGKEFYYCATGANSRHDPGCRKSRININLVRASCNSLGLKAGITPLLLLTLYRYLEDKEQTARELRNLAKYEAQMAVQEDKLAQVASFFVEADIPGAMLKRVMDKVAAKVKGFERKIAELRLMANSGVDCELFSKLSQGGFLKIFNGTLDEGTFELLLRMAIQRIDVFEDHLDILTIYGKFTLDRFMDRQFRNMPRFKATKISTWENESDLSKCVYEITYVYGDGGQRRLNVDFGKVKIFELK